SLVRAVGLGDKLLERSVLQPRCPAPAPFADTKLTVARRCQPCMIGAPAKNLPTSAPLRQNFPAAIGEPFTGVGESTAGDHGFKHPSPDVDVAIAGSAAAGDDPDVAHGDQGADAALDRAARSAGGRRHAAKCRWGETSLDVEGVSDLDGRGDHVVGVMADKNAVQPRIEPRIAGRVFPRRLLKWRLAIDMLLTHV